MISNTQHDNVLIWCLWISVGKFFIVKLVGQWNIWSYKHHVTCRFQRVLRYAFLCISYICSKSLFDRFKTSKLQWTFYNLIAVNVRSYIKFYHQYLKVNEFIILLAVYNDNAASTRSTCYEHSKMYIYFEFTTSV